MRMPDLSFGDYADEDTVTVALPRPQGQGRQLDAYAPQGQGRQPDAYAPQGQGRQPDAFAPQGQRRQPGSYVPQEQRRQSGAYIPQGQERQFEAYAPQGQSRQPDTYASEDDDTVTVALSQKAAAGAVRKPSFKPVVGWLVCVRGSDFGSSFTIRLGKNHIGRAADMDIVLHGDDSIAMKNHAAVYYVPKQRRFAVEPGASGKRFYLNRDAVIRPVWIKQHDILIIGNSSLMFFPCCGEHFSWEELIRRQREKNQIR